MKDGIEDGIGHVEEQAKEGLAIELLLLGPIKAGRFEKAQPSAQSEPDRGVVRSNAEAR